jgi:polysaccharide deacetylase family protein (PEP-CTERM system associated)
VEVNNVEIDIKIPDLLMNILTFDIEDWFHILNDDHTRTDQQWDLFEYRIHENVERLITLIQSTGHKATFFVLGWIAEKFPDIVKKITGLGYEIGTHSHMHQLVFDQSPSDFTRDLEYSISLLEDLTGKKVRYYRAPGFSINEKCLWVFDILIEKGIEIDSSIFPARRGHGGFKTFEFNKPMIIKNKTGTIKEFPISTASFFNHRFVFSGGGYYRFYPYFMISRFLKKSDYLMTYFHPRDFDPDQPVIRELPPIRKFKSYFGLKGAYCKLEKLLREFDFVDLKEAEQMMTGKELQIYSINN